VTEKELEKKINGLKADLDRLAEEMNKKRKELNSLLKQLFHKRQLDL